MSVYLYVYVCTYMLFHFLICFICKVWLKVESVTGLCCIRELPCWSQHSGHEWLLCIRTLSTRILIFRPNPQGLNPHRHLWGFFWCCRHAVHLPLPTPRVPSELRRTCKGSQWPCTWDAPSAIGSSMRTGSPVLSMSPSPGALLRPPEGLNPSKWALLASAGGAPSGRRKSNWHPNLPYILYQCKSVSISVSHQGTPPVWGGDCSLSGPETGLESVQQGGGTTPLWLGISSLAGAILLIGRKQHQRWSMLYRAAVVHRAQAAWPCFTSSKARSFESEPSSVWGRHGGEKADQGLQQ